MSSSLVANTEASPAARGPSFVLTPHLNGIEPECEKALQQLEQAGVRVVRRAGSSAIDVVRNEMLSDALHDGAESILFIDSDIGFEPKDAPAFAGPTGAGGVGRLRQEEPARDGEYLRGRREGSIVWAGGGGAV